MNASTPHTLLTLARLQRARGFLRLTGSAVARGELVLGESAVAVPVFGCAGEVIAALELAVDHDRVERPRLRLLSASDGATAPL